MDAPIYIDLPPHPQPPIALPLLQLSSLGIDSRPGMVPVDLNIVAGAVVKKESDGTTQNAWAGDYQVGTSGSAKGFTITVDYICGVCSVVHCGLH